MEKLLSIVTPLMFGGLIYFIRRLILAHDDNTKALNDFNVKVAVLVRDVDSVKDDVKGLKRKVFGTGEH